MIWAKLHRQAEQQIRDEEAAEQEHMTRMSKEREAYERPKPFVVVIPEYDRDDGSNFFSGLAIAIIASAPIWCVIWWLAWWVSRRWF